MLPFAEQQKQSLLPDGMDDCEQYSALAAVRGLYLDQSCRIMSKEHKLLCSCCRHHFSKDQHPERLRQAACKPIRYAVGCVCHVMYKPFMTYERTADCRGAMCSTLPMLTPVGQTWNISGCHENGPALLLFHLDWTAGADSLQAQPAVTLVPELRGYKP